MSTRIKHNKNYYIQWEKDYFIRKGIIYKVEDVIEYYINQNLRRKDAAIIMGLEDGVLMGVLKHYNIKKDPTLSVALQKETCLLKYGTANYMDTEECKNKIKQTCIKKYGIDSYNKLPEYVEKRKQTCLERYGDENYQNREQINQTLFQNYGVDSLGKLNTIESILEKKRQTNLKNRGVEYPLQSQEVLDKFDWDAVCEKAFATRIQNNTTNTSKAELRIKEFLFDKFGEKNILTQYKDEERYPYHCDFYIKPLDLFIELNLFFTHEKHPFNKENNEDKIKLEDWEEKSKSSQFYKNAIEVWTIKDIEKQLKAKNSNINYLAFYKEEDVYSYLNNININKGEVLYEIIY